jgi:uncharacterized protein YdhG (YjbR/CyaY superfamily)
MKTKTPSQTIDDYIASFPPKVRAILKKIRLTVNKAAPQAEERISYRMPALFQNGVVIYFAAFKSHIGIFPPVRGDADLNKELAPFRGPKGNLKFPLDKPMPYGLMARIVTARLRENLTRVQKQKKN